MPRTLTARSEGIWQYINPIRGVRNIWKHRELIRQFTQREIEGRYRGSLLGLLWSFVNPLIQLLIYTFVFGFIFSARWPNARSDNLAEFALTLFCGITAFNIFGESISRAPTTILGVPNYVKKVVFPLEILSVSSIGAALFHGAISVGILLVGNLLMSGYFPWTVLLFPFVLIPLVFLCLGLSWLLASLGVFIRDIGYIIALVVQVLLFTSPIFFPIDRIPEPFRAYIQFNPLSSIVENFRRVLLWGQVPNWGELGIWSIVTGIIMLLGYAWFMKTRKAFADVL